MLLVLGIVGGLLAGGVGAIYLLVRQINVKDIL